MLHLNRKKNEVIYLQNNSTGEIVTLVVLEVRGKTVKLGFENDSRSHTVLRKEVKQKQENHENPNPYYMDRIPKSYLFKKEQQKNNPTTFNKDEKLEGLVDQLFNENSSNDSTTTTANDTPVEMKAA